ncbi:hypothetical protein MMC31_006217 [Peltigera leucophlebia]|nr:hypothetical protein [Peltigera leucophlebia]
MSSSLYIDATPDEVKNAKYIHSTMQGLHLLTCKNSPNGEKTQIMLEELKELYGTAFTTTIINLKALEQKTEWFLRLNPNGRIPTLVDNSQSPPYTVMESAAQILYLSEVYDKNFELSFKDSFERYDAYQWLLFWNGTGSSVQQWAYFSFVAEERNPGAIERFEKEAERIFGVLEIHLSGKFSGESRDYLAGKGRGKYSIADIGTWATIKEIATTPLKAKLDECTHLSKYIERIAQRPACQRGIGKSNAA